MHFFQNSVLNKHLKAQDTQAIKVAYAKFTARFHNPVVQENIRNSKEEQYQGEFLIDLFVNVLGYIKNPAPDYNITTEYKNVKDSKKADGAILVAKEHAHSPQVIAVIELKGTETTDLNRIEAQAFGYKNNQPECVYVITSNFEKLRFYIDNAIENIEFNLFTLTEKEFELLWLCLAYVNIEKNLAKRIKDESVSQEDVITKSLYNDYSLFKRELHQNLVAVNPEHDPLTLFKKSQKLLDRFLFLFFAEDRQLLPPNSVRLILDDWRDLQDKDVDIALYSRFKKYFEYLNTGFKGKRYDVFAYNGGLFKHDELLDQIKMDDELLYRHTMKLSEYDFVSEVDVNILGHIFENSLNELDEIKAQLEGQQVDKAKSKRKKDGVFYTPKYITKYIVDNTIGKLCTEKKAEIGLIEEEYITDRKRTNKTKQPLFDKLNTYRNWLLQLTICDPACGSGAFLNQALDFLINEHRYIDELQAKLFGDAMVLSDFEKNILENNLFGVDINEESVEIAKLSLWLRTAQPNRKLNDLNNNIKCGNSLIDDPAVAGDKAFNWQEEFPTIFPEKAKKVWHITTATHNSRYSQRMLDYHVQVGDPVWLSEKEEIIVTETIAKIVIEDKLNVMAYNICGDHMHLVLVCEDEELPSIMQKIKSMSARACNIAMGRTKPQAVEHAPRLEEERGVTQFHLWTQKYGSKEIVTEEQLGNTIAYVQNNRIKHQLSSQNIDNSDGACSIAVDTNSIAIDTIASTFTCSVSHALRTEYKGGFDVVIGNPPYGAELSDEHKQYLSNIYKTFEYQVNTYVLFYERGIALTINGGILGYITPATFTYQHYFKKLREFIQEYTQIGISKYLYEVFEDADIGDSVSWILQKTRNTMTDIIISISTSKEDSTKIPRVKNYNTIINQDRTYNISESDINYSAFFEHSEILGDIAEIIVGIKAYQTGKGIPKQMEEDVKNKMFTSDRKIDETYIQCIIGKDFHRYCFLQEPNMYLSYGKWLAEPRESAPFFEEEKIILRQTSDSLIGTIDNKKRINLNNVYNVGSKAPEYNLKYLLALLNSKLMNLIYQNVSQEKGRVFAEVKKVNLSKLPIKITDEETQKTYVEKVDSIISRSSELLEITTKFQRTIQRKFNLEDLPGKLLNWYLLTYAEFITELAKKKVKLSLTEEAEWEAYFLQEAKQALALKSEIDKTDKEIDRMVYELYGLTDEEIKIVEGTN